MSRPVTHRERELEQARAVVVEAARALLAARIPNTSTFPQPHVWNLVEALHAFDTLLADAEHATELHLVHPKGSRLTMCGRDAGAVPYGFAKPSYVDEWIAAGQRMCPGCMSAYRGGS
jgi:hypothetical protein